MDYIIRDEELIQSGGNIVVTIPSIIPGVVAIGDGDINEMIVENKILEMQTVSFQGRASLRLVIILKSPPRIQCGWGFEVERGARSSRS